MSNYLFGPVPSRRLGISLGLDLVPHKTCSLNCIYCESGKTTNLTIERKEYIPTAVLISELTTFLKTKPKLDYITFSGAGEPTLHSDIGTIVTFIKKNYPDYQLALITNGTLFYLSKLRREVKPVDLILPSLDAVSEKTLTDSQIDKLLGHKLMESWIIDADQIKPLADEISEAEESPIIVSGGQSANRIDDIKQKGIKELYQDPKRLLLKNRLEEMAYVFLKLNEEEYTHLSLAAAFSLDEKDSFMKANPFLMAMVERSLNYYTQMAKEIAKSEGLEADSSPRILVP